MLIRRILHVAAVLACGHAVTSAQTPTVSTLTHFEGVDPVTVKGRSPRGGLLFGHDGLLYGTTQLGGTAPTVGNSGAGTIYKVTPDGSFTFISLADFESISTGSGPTGRLLLASDGNYYGTTAAAGGPTGSQGTVFQLTPAGTLTTVYTFTTATRVNTGINPTDHLVEGADGYLYGTTALGGINNLGTIFKILPGTSSTPVRVVDFSGGGNGSSPSALVLAKDGNFYGVAGGGGLYGNGTVFKLTPTGSFTVLANFGSITGTYSGPVSPNAALIQARDGLLYGVSASGGTGNAGTVFSVTTAGVYKVLVNFSGTSGAVPGNTPDASLMQATDGNLYGSTNIGGASNRGTLFRVSTAGVFKNLIQFTGGAPVFGAKPRGALVQDNEGHLFGTTSEGGNNNFGTVFRLDNAIPEKPTVNTLGLSTAPGDPNGGTRATLTGEINPRGTTAFYHFEYGTTTAYGTRGPVSAASDPNAGKGTTLTPVKMVITGLTPSTTYHYRLVSNNGGGTTWGGDQTFTTSPNPNIVTPPTDQLVGVGTPAQFDVAAIGGALGYAWLKAPGTSVLGTAASYRIASAALTHAGSYSVRVNDGGDVVTTAPARLGVISLASSPSLIVNEGAEITLVLPNAGPGLAFQWKTPTGNVINDARISGAQTAALRITNATAADTNTYHCTVTLGALTLDSGNFVLTTRLRPVMNMPALGPWTVNGLASGAITAQNSPTSYAAVLLPPGVLLNRTTGVFSGRPTAPGIYTAQFTATNLAGSSAVLNYAITVLAPLTGEVGSFAGNTIRDATANTNLGGGINFTLTTTGTGTGKLTHKGKVFSFTTALNASPGSTRAITITPSAGQTGFPPVVATLTGATGDVTGTINGAAFTAKRNPFGTTNPVPAAQLGRFNVAFAPTSPELGDPAFPQGWGYGTLTIDTVGNAVWNGKLSDGVVITSSTIFTGEVALHHALYIVGTGSAQGSIAIAGDGTVSSPGIDWLKTLQSGSTRSYKNGFARHLLALVGSKYVKPATNTPVIGLTGSTSNAEFTFTDAGLSPAITQLANFPATNVITFPTANPNTVKVTSLDLNTGIFAGSFIEPDAVAANTRTATFAGILLQGTSEGLGHFNLSQLPGPTTSIMLSGAVELAAP